MINLLNESVLILQLRTKRKFQVKQSNTFTKFILSRKTSRTIIVRITYFSTPQKHSLEKTMFSIKWDHLSVHFIWNVCSQTHVISALLHSSVHESFSIVTSGTKRLEFQCPDTYATGATRNISEENTKNTMLWPHG